MPGGKRDKTSIKTNKNQNKTKNSMIIEIIIVLKVPCVCAINIVGTRNPNENAILFVSLLICQFVFLSVSLFVKLSFCHWGMANSLKIHLRNPRPGRYKNLVIAFLIYRV